MILVIGATGNTGGELLKLLTAAKIPTRAFIRNRAKAQELEKMGAEVFLGDLERPTTLDPALEGVEKVFVATTWGSDLPAREHVIFESCRSSRVKQLVKVSVLGAAEEAVSSVGRWHFTAEEDLKNSKLPFTILRPHYFFQNIFNFTETIRSQKAFYAPMGDGKISAIDVRDIAQVAFTALTQEGHLNKTYNLTGPEALSFHDWAKALSEESGKTVRYVPVEDDEAKQALTEAGLPKTSVRALVALYGEFREGKGEAVTTTVQDVTGKPARKFRDFAKEIAKALVG